MLCDYLGKETPSASIPVFIARLSEMAQSSERYFPGCCGWGSEGDSFVIYNKEGFESSVLPSYSSSANLNSFIRQMNRYGFWKQSRLDKSSIEFKHPHFRRDRPELLPFIPTPGKAQQQQQQQQQPNNFPLLPLQKHLKKTPQQQQHQQDLSAWHQHFQEREHGMNQYDLFNKQRQPSLVPSYPDQLRQQQQQPQGPETAHRFRSLSYFPNNQAAEAAAAAPSATTMWGASSFPSLFQAAMPSVCIAGVGANTAMASSPCGDQTSDESGLLESINSTAASVASSIVQRRLLKSEVSALMDSNALLREKVNCSLSASSASATLCAEPNTLGGLETNQHYHAYQQELQQLQKQQLWEQQQQQRKYQEQQQQLLQQIYQQQQQQQQQQQVHPQHQSFQGGCASFQVENGDEVTRQPFSAMQSGSDGDAVECSGVGVARPRLFSDNDVAPPPAKMARMGSAHPPATTTAATAPWLSTSSIEVKAPSKLEFLVAAVEATDGIKTKKLHEKMPASRKLVVKNESWACVSLV